MEAGPVVTTLRRVVAGAAPAGVPGARDAVRSVLAGLFGRSGPAFGGVSAPGDPGLLGPDSVSWRVIAEPAAIAGGLRALLLQLLHPLAMAGVADHSAYREDPLGRLERTSAWVTVSTFGATEEALAVARRVRGVHRPVTGTAPDGRRYDAADPRLLVWVSIALTSSFLVADRLWSPWPVDADDRDRFVAEQSRLAALLDPRVDLEAVAADASLLAELRAGTLPLPLLNEGALPSDERQLDRVLASFEAELAVNDQGRDALGFLRRPPLPDAARLGYRSLFWGAVGSLPPRQRALHGLDLGPARARLAVRQAGALLTTMRVATGPSPALDAARARAAAAPSTLAGFDG